MVTRIRRRTVQKQLLVTQITTMVWSLMSSQTSWSVKSSALGNITMNKASGCDRTPDQLLQILKDDAIKVPHSLWQQTWKILHWPQEGKRSVFILIPKKGNAKEG